MNLNHLVNSIKENEGCELKVYKCPKGVNTIGYGRNLEHRGISQEEANYLLRNDIKKISIELYRKISFFKDLDEARQSVLIEMAYNMGTPNLLNFKNTLTYLSANQFEKASIEMLDSKWHRDFVKYDMQDGVKFNGLLRSEHLAKIMKEGKY